MDRKYIYRSDGVPVGVESVLRKALAGKSEERYQGAGVFADDLQALLPAGKMDILPAALQNTLPLDSPAHSGSVDISPDQHLPETKL